MLIDAHELEAVAGHDGLHFGKHVGVDAELGLLAAGDDLIAVACADAGVETHHDAAAGNSLAEKFQLGKGVHAHHVAVFRGVLQLFGAHVVAHIGELGLAEAGKLVDVQFTGAHGVHHASFGTDDLQQGRIGVGLGGVVHPEAGMGREAGKVAAAGTQDVLVIDIERRAETGHELAGIFLPVEVHAVGVGGAYVRHGEHLETMDLLRRGCAGTPPAERERGEKEASALCSFAEGNAGAQRMRNALPPENGRAGTP